ncbi:hypothetical protein COOONC_13199 [Cooperia oncophora]
MRRRNQEQMLLEELKNARDEKDAQRGGPRNETEFTSEEQTIEKTDCKRTNPDRAFDDNLDGADNETLSITGSPSYVLI